MTEKTCSPNLRKIKAPCLPPMGSLSGVQEKRRPLTQREMKHFSFSTLVLCLARWSRGERMLPFSLVYDPYRIRSLTLPVQPTSVLSSEVPAGITQIAGTGPPTLSCKAQRRPQNHSNMSRQLWARPHLHKSIGILSNYILEDSHAFTFQLSSIIRSYFILLADLNYYNRPSSNSNTLQIVTCLWETRNIKIPTKVYCLGDPYSRRII